MEQQQVKFLRIGDHVIGTEHVVRIDFSKPGQAMVTHSAGGPSIFEGQDAEDLDRFFSPTPAPGAPAPAATEKGNGKKKAGAKSDAEPAAAE